MNRVDCNKCQELLDAKWDGDALAADDRQACDEHLLACATCRQYQADMTRVLKAASSMRELSYERPIEVSPLVLHPHATRPFLAGALAASGIAVALFVGVVAGGRLNRDSNGAPETQMVRLVVPMADAKRVEVVGDFTGWKNRIELAPAENGLWVGEVKVVPGRYKYMIVVDDNALQPDPAAREVVDDGFGGKNSVLEVGGRDIARGI